MRLLFSDTVGKLEKHVQNNLKCWREYKLQVHKSNKEKMPEQIMESKNLDQ